MTLVRPTNWKMLSRVSCYLNLATIGWVHWISECLLCPFNLCVSRNPTIPSHLYKLVHIDHPTLQLQRVSSPEITFKKNKTLSSCGIKARKNVKSLVLFAEVLRNQWLRFVPPHQHNGGELELLSLFPYETTIYFQLCQQKISDEYLETWTNETITVYMGRYH